jgi:outer membrane protein, heavy metal efflux system
MSIRQNLLLASLALACTTTTQALAQTPSATPTTSPASSPATATAPISLNQALQDARNNLDVALARHSLAGAQADILSANRSPFPTLSAKLSQMDLQNGLGDGNFFTEKRVDKAIGLDWMWERGNKRELRTLTARQVAAAAQADLDEVRTQQLLATQAGFFDLLVAQERGVEFSLIERSAAQLAVTANKRLQAGDLSALDASRTEIEAQRAHADLQAAELERQRAAISLWQLTGIATPAQQLQAQADWPAHIGALAPAPDLYALIETRADVRAAQARVQAAQAALDGSSAQKVSDITVGASYDHFPGTSTALMELRVQMPLQWGYSYQGEIARAAAQLAQAQDALEKVRRLAQAELQGLQQLTQSTAQRAQSYETEILPRARKVADGAELAYNKGALSLTDLLDARRTLRSTLLDALNARADYARASVAWQLRTQTN